MTETNNDTAATKPKPADGLRLLSFLLDGGLCGSRRELKAHNACLDMTFGKDTVDEMRKTLHSACSETKEDND